MHAVMNSGLLGSDYQQYTQSNLSIFDVDFVRSIWFEAVLILFMVLIFDLLFSIKIGLWSEKSARASKAIA